MPIGRGSEWSLVPNRVRRERSAESVNFRLARFGALLFFQVADFIYVTDLRSARVDPTRQRSHQLVPLCGFRHGQFVRSQVASLIEEGQRTIIGDEMLGKEGLG